MLVLTRKTHEAIVIGDHSIRVVVLSVQGDQVKLGIEAPREISVMREEVVAAQEENQRAADAVSPERLSALTTKKAPAPPSPDR